MKSDQVRTPSTRLTELRRHLRQCGFDGFVVPLTDEHRSEYVGDYAQRLRWLTGFRGSAGTAVVLSDQAAVFVDGRYSVQVRRQVDQALWSCHDSEALAEIHWIERQAGKGARIGYDPWLCTRAWAIEARLRLGRVGVELATLEPNPIDALWEDQPAPGLAPITGLPECLSGLSSLAKRREIAAVVREAGGEVALISALDSVAWTFNIRSADVSRTPVVRAFAAVHADGGADLFVDPAKLTGEVRTHLGPVRLHAYASFPAYLDTLAGVSVLIDPEQSVDAIHARLDRAGARVVVARDPVVHPKSIKNGAEIDAHKHAQILDGGHDALPRLAFARGAGRAGRRV